MPWGYAAVAGATLIGGSMAAGSASDAADAQTQASQQSIAEQQREFDQTQANQAPFIATGTAANAKLSDLLGTSTNTGAAGYGSLLKSFDATDLANDPVYNSGLQFGLNQGTGAINQRALQSGGYDSGATLKALTQYANDYGSTKANDAYNRYNTDQSNIYNRLAGISGTGQTAVNQVSTAGANTANQISSSLSDAGNASSAGIIGGSNAWNSAIGGVNGIYQNYNSNQNLQSLLGGSNYNSYMNNANSNGFGTAFSQNGYSTDPAYG